jgi:hypothetical protein
MSQRLIQPGLSALAGTIIGYRKNGLPIHLAAGGSGDGEGEGGDDSTGDEGGGDDSDEEESDDEDDKDKKSKKSKDDDEDDEEEVVSKRKLDKALERMKAADRRSSELQAKLDELKDAAKVPDEIKRELAEVKAVLAEKDKAIETITKARNASTIKLAALTIKGAPDWENVEAALRLTDLEDVDVEDDGTVDKRALKAALKKTALEHPYLVKKPAKDTTDTSGAGTGGGTGSTMNKRTGKPQAADRATLATRFPVLNQR